MSEILCLPKPYGWPNGTGISLQARSPVNGDVVAGVTLSFGCPPFILPRVSASMELSGRYDCRVTLSKEALRNLKCCMDVLDVDVVVLDETGGYRKFDDGDFR